MYEVEMKVRAAHGPVRERLVAADATRESVVYQADTYYDAPHRSFVETDEALRVRRERELSPDAPTAVDDVAAVLDHTEAGKAEESQATASDDGTNEDPEATGMVLDSRITYKGPRVDEASKTRREVETGVEDGDAAGAIFEALGFEPAATVRKRREHWALDGVTVTLDEVTGLGEFVEAEIDSPEELDLEGDGDAVADLDAARDRVAATLRSLDLDPDDQIRTSYLGLLLESDAGDAAEGEDDGA